MLIFISLRHFFFISFLFVCFALPAQRGADLDSLYHGFNKLVGSDDQAAWQSFKKLEELAAQDRVAAVYFNLAKANSFMEEGEREQAFGACMDALDIARELKSDSLLFRVYHHIGSVYMNNNDLLRALPYLNKAALLVNSVRNANARIFLFRDIALLYSYINKNREAIECWLKVEPLILQTGNKIFLGNIYNNLGICYMELEDTARARQYFQQSLLIRYEIKDGHGIAQVHNNLGTLYLNSMQYQKALEYFEKGLELRKKANVVINGIIESNINIGKVHYKLGHAEIAKKYLEEARAQALGIGQIELERRADEELVLIYSGRGDYKKAFELQSRFFMIKDSLYGLDKKEEVGRMNFESKLREDSLKHEEARQKESAIHTEKQKRAALIRNISIGGFILALCVAFVLFAQVKRIRAANRTIADQKDQIEQKQKEVLDSIHYAKRIQQSLLPSNMDIEKSLKKLQGRS